MLIQPIAVCLIQLVCMIVLLK